MTSLSSLRTKYDDAHSSDDDENDACLLDAVGSRTPATIDRRRCRSYGGASAPATAAGGAEAAASGAAAGVGRGGPRRGRSASQVVFIVAGSSGSGAGADGEEGSPVSAAAEAVAIKGASVDEERLFDVAVPELVGVHFDPAEFPAGEEAFRQWIAAGLGVWVYTTTRREDMELVLKHGPQAIFIDFKYWISRLERISVTYLPSIAQRLPLGCQSRSVAELGRRH